MCASGNNIMMTGTDEVAITVYVESENEPRMDLSGRCAGDTKLVDYVRRKIQRSRGLQLMQPNRRMVLQMSRCGLSNWTSPAKEFKVMCRVKACFHYGCAARCER